MGLDTCDLTRELTRNDEPLWPGMTKSPGHFSARSPGSRRSSSLQRLI